MKRVTLILSCFMLLVSVAASCQTPDHFVSEFFKEFEQKGSSEAIDGLYSTNKWVLRNQDAVTNLKTQMAQLTEDYVGKYYGYDIILERKLGQSFVLQSYLVRYERQPIRFTFQFYKPDDQWMLFAFQFDTNLDSEIEEAAKLYYMELDKGY